VARKKTAPPPPGPRPLTPAELRWRCPPASLRPVVAADAAEAKAEAARLEAELPDARARGRKLARRRLGDRPAVALEAVVGQARAAEALAVGLSTEAPGFHVAVVGPPGSGREALVRAALTRRVPPLPPARDLLYVASFRHPSRPRLLSLPRGKGRRFLRDLDDVLAVLARSIPAALDDPLHVGRCDRLRRRADGQATRLIEDLAAGLRLRGLAVGPIPQGFATPELRILTDDGEPLSPRAIAGRLARGELRRTAALRRALAEHAAARAELERVAGLARAASRTGTLAVRRLEARIAKDLARGFADDLARAHPTEAVRRWTRSFVAAVGERLEVFFAARPRDDGPPPPPGPPGPDEPPPDDRRPGDPLAVFRANLFVDARERPPAPVVFEPNPTFQNLLGSLDGDPALPEHHKLRAGSLLRANGGVLVTDLGELLADPVAWRAVKRAVRSGWIEVQRAAAAGAAMRPEPVRTALRLVALATDDVWERAGLDDPDTTDVFKVEARTEDDVPVAEAPALAAALLRAARGAGLRPPDAPALARLLEHAARLAGRCDRLATRFAALLDVLQEADRLALAARRGTIRRADVEAALAQRRRRVDHAERQLQRLFDDGLVLLDLDGARAGVVNALVVYDHGEHVFGRPCRVTAAVGVGRRGVVDVEREVRLSGDHHHKGIQLLAGLLCERYAQAHPLALNATVAFEQSYAPVDGDSASLAEALAVLSALGDLPIDQGLAVTGSLNQKGEVQPVGDVDAKIEGHFDACRSRGLTGRQGVLIPASNVKDLMLREDVVEAVAAGTYRVVPVRTLDEALTLVTGAPAPPRPAPLAPYPEGTAHARVDARLAAFARVARGAAPLEE